MQMFENACIQKLMNNVACLNAFRTDTSFEIDNTERNLYNRINIAPIESHVRENKKRMVKIIAIRVCLFSNLCKRSIDVDIASA